MENLDSSTLAVLGGRCVVYFQNDLKKEQKKYIIYDDLQRFKECPLSHEKNREDVCLIQKIFEMKSYKILDYLYKKNYLQEYLKVNIDTNLEEEQKYAISVCTELMCRKDYRGLIKLLNLGVIQLDEFYMNNFVWYEYLDSNKYYTKQKAECNRFRRYNNLMAMSINRLIDISQLKLNLGLEKVSLIRYTENCVQELESIYELLENILKAYKKELNGNTIIEKHINYKSNRTKNKEKEYTLKYKLEILDKYVQEFVKEYDILELTAENAEERLYNIKIIEKVQTMKNIFSNSIYLLSTNIKDK